MITVWGDSNNTELNTALADWAKAHIPGIQRGFGDCTTMGVFDGAKLIAVVVFNNFDRLKGVIEMHMAAISKLWLTRPVMLEMARYVFDELGCQTAFVRADPGESRIMRMLLAYGFDRFLLPRMRGRETDEAFYLLHDDEWRQNNRFHKENAHGR